MPITEEMKEMMKRSMEEYFAAYWKGHATPEQEAKRVAEGKTFGGAAVFVESVAEKHKGTAAKGRSVVAMPDDLAYWLLMEYMENGKEGSKYKTPEEIEAEAKKRAESAKKEKEAEAKAAERRAKESAKKIAEKVKNSQLTLF